MYCLAPDPENDNEEAWTIVPKPEVGISKEEFQDGKRDLALISSCSSTGISLHADRKRPNSRKRIHITLEYGWGPETFLQQLGRSHRSDQVYPPEYIIIRSIAPAEERYISVMSKRIKQMVSCKSAIQILLQIFECKSNSRLYFLVR